MRFFDSQAKAEAKITKQHADMVEKLVARGLASSWQNEAQAARTDYTTMTTGGSSSASSWISDIAYEQPEILDRPKRGSRSHQPDAAPVRGPSGRSMYRSERLFDIRGIFGARRGDALDGRKDYGRWPETSIPSRGTPTSHDYGPPAWTQVVRGGGRDGCPGCPQC